LVATVVAGFSFLPSTPPPVRYLSTSVEGGAEALAEVRLNGSPPFLSYAWKPVLYILAHALMSLLGCAASGLFL